MEPYSIRTVRPEDAAELLHIYAPYVLYTAVTFEYDVPTTAEFEHRICQTLQKYPYLAAVHDGHIAGYAYAGAFKNRRAYDRAVETSIYIRQDIHGQGLGRALYTRLEDLLRRQHITNVNACIAVPSGQEDACLTRDSVHFHEHMGYRLVGEFHNCGYKFERWYNMVWMEKHIAPHIVPPKAVIPFPELEW